MKVFVVIVFVIASAAARGSGPYLPSGWRPQGPAFFLPSEVAEPAVSPLKEAFQETETSGSDALREYGPPKLGDVFLNVNQALPDVATEQSFSVQGDNVVNAAVEVVIDEAPVTAIIEEIPTAIKSESVETATEIVKEEIAEVFDVQSTKSQTDVEQEKEVLIQSEEVKEINTPTTEEAVIATAVESEVVSLAVQELVQDSIPTVTEEAVNVIQQEAVPTAAFEEIIAPTIAQDVSQQELGQEVATVVEAKTVDVTEEAKAPVSLAVQELVQEVVSPLKEEFVGEKTESINNVGETIVNLENVVTAIEAEGVGNNGDISSTQKASGALEQDPASFLDYNPPGFAVYGPPLQDDLARLTAAEVSSNAWDNNGERRRRLSPKFSSSKNKSK